MFNKIEPLILKQQRLTRLVKFLIVISIVCFALGIIMIPTVLSGVFIVVTIISIVAIFLCRKRIDSYAQEIQQLRDEMKQTDLPPATIELVEGGLEKVEIASETEQPTNDKIVEEESMCLDETKEVEMLEEVKSQEEQTEALVEEQVSELVEEQIEALIEVSESIQLAPVSEDVVTKTSVEVVEEAQEQVEMLEEVTTVEEPVLSEVAEKTFDELILDQLKQLTNNENLTTKTVGKYVDVISENGKVRFKLTGRKTYMLATLSEDEANALSLKTEAPAKTEKYSVRIMLSEAKELEPLASYLMTILNRA